MRDTLTSSCCAVLLALAGCGTPAADPRTGPPLSDAERDQARLLMRLAEVPAAQVNATDQKRLVRLAGEQRCPCPQGGSLAECAENARTPSGCVRAAFAVRAIVRGLVRQEADDAIAARLVERFGPREPERVDLEGAPCRGRPDAPVTLVVFSDFECPFCSLGRELTDAVAREAGDRLRVCFKHWPLSRIHPKAQLAAQAAVAAQLQGKFWPMHDRLFGQQKHLDRGDLIEAGRAIGLDVERFQADIDSAAVQARVGADVAEARRLRLEGTPAFLVNGRRMTDPKAVPDFLDWIAEAIALAKGAR